MILYLVGNIEYSLDNEISHSLQQFVQVLSVNIGSFDQLIYIFLPAEKILPMQEFSCVFQQLSSNILTLQMFLNLPQLTINQ